MQGFSEKTRQWFFSSVGTPTEAQRMGWQAISQGRDALISSPTGSGKTLAAFLYFLDEMRREQDAGALAEGLRIVYISPLKALGNDIRQNLERPLAGLGLTDAVRVAVRTGDTDARARREMAKHPPHILITTPESLYLLLTSLSGREMLKTARTVIVDELHAVVSSKRGTHLFLSLARLDALCGRHVRRVGLSATVNPPEEAARHLTGGEPCAVIVPKIEKRAELTVDVPVPDMRQLPEHSVWPAIAERILRALGGARTVLAFVDGRAGCERLALKINERAGKTLARTHHGCVSKEQRLEAERMLKSGELRVMVATSSMELGIDVGEIDLVVQVGAPPSVSSLLQRLGRAGHGPGRVSRMCLYPRTAAETIGCALVCEAAREGRIERVRAPEMCLDVLSQHLVSMAATGTYTVDEAVRVLSRAYGYRRLASEDVKAVLGMLSGDYERMDDRPVKPRLIYDRLSGRVSGDAYTRMLALSSFRVIADHLRTSNAYTRMLALSSGGTIPDRGWFAVTLADGTHLGELDEEFVFEARLGDKFYLGAFPWKIEEITRDRVIVSHTSPEGASSPFWKGDRTARAYETGAFYGSLLAGWEDAARQSPAALRAALRKTGLTPDAAENAARVLENQLHAVGCLATNRVLVAEHFSDEAGEHQLMLHSPFGDAVNRALGMLLSRRAASAAGTDARAYDDDDGALITLLGGREIPDDLLPALACDDAPGVDARPCDDNGARLASVTPNTASSADACACNDDGARLAFAAPNAASGADAHTYDAVHGARRASGADAHACDAVPSARISFAAPVSASGAHPSPAHSGSPSIPFRGAAAEVRAMLPASPMFSMAFRCNVQRALLNGVRGGRRQPLWVQRLRGSEALGAAAAHPEHPMMRETLNECASDHLDLRALAQLLSAIRAGQVRVYEVHTGTPSPLCLNLRRQVEAEMMYETAIPSAATALSRDALLTLTPTREAVESASRPTRAPRSADELHARLMAEGDLLAEEADAPAEWMDALELSGRAVYIEPGLWIARENEAEYRRALEEADASAFARIVRRAARFHGAQTAETLSERYAVDEACARETLNALLSEGVLRRLGDAYIHAELYESAQRMTVVLNRRRVETQPARAFARMLSQRVRGVGSSAAQLAQALNRLRGCEYPASAWEGWLLPARVSGYRPQLLDEALARGEFAYRVLPAEPARRAVPGEAAHMPGEAACRTLLNEAAHIPGEAACRIPFDEAACRVPSSEASHIPGEAACRTLPNEASHISGEAACRIVPGEASHIPGEAACHIPSDGASQASSEPRIRDAAHHVPSGEASRFSGEAACRIVPGEASRFSGEAACRIPSDGASHISGEAACLIPSDGASQFSGEAACRIVPGEASHIPGEAARRIFSDEASQPSTEPRIRSEVACRTLPAETLRIPSEASQASTEPRIRDNAACRIPSDEASQFSGEAACRIPFGDASHIPGEAARRILSSEASQPSTEPRIRNNAFCRVPSGGCPRGAASRSALDARARASDVGMPNRNSASGKAGARAVSGERARVRFDLPDDEGDYEPLPNDLTDAERAVLQTLTLRGASFASRLPANAGDALKTLLARGLVRADSFLPVREMLAAESASVKKTVRRRVRVMDAGRWSRVGAPVQADAETRVERLFDRFGIVCRETAGADWNAALGVLKHMEYAGTARRGYFVKGLSGAQFVREADFASITARLRQPSDECIWLPAADPMQAWGACLAHEEGRAFLRVPGTAVALLDGAAVAVSEKQGETLRILDEATAPAALRALADAFRRGTIFPALSRLIVKKYPPAVAAYLEAAGFVREMLDYTLMRRG